MCFLKYSGIHWPISHCSISSDNFFRFVSGLNLVNFSDLLIVKYAYLCLQIKVKICSF